MIRQAAKLFAIILLFSSCKQENDKAQLATLISGLTNSNNVIKSSNDLLYSACESRAKDFEYESWAGHWFPKTEQIKALSATMLFYIDSVIAISDLQPQSIENELYTKLFEYKRNVVTILNPDATTPSYRIDYLIWHKKMLQNEIPVLAFITDTIVSATNEISKNQWRDSTFRFANTLMQKAVLLKTKNDVLITEQMLSQFCFRQIDIKLCGFSPVVPVANISSSQIKQGESIEVTTGIAEFMGKVKPRFIINGKEVPVNGYGFTTYTFRPNGKPGKHTLPIVIEYTKPDRTIARVNKILRYTITE